MDITPIQLQIIKRKLSFIMQLVRNQTTNELITKGNHKCLDDIIESIGIKQQHKDLGQKGYEGMLLAAFTAKLEYIKQCEKILKKCL